MAESVLLRWSANEEIKLNCFVQDHAAVLQPAGEPRWDLRRGDGSAEASLASLPPHGPPARCSAPTRHCLQVETPEKRRFDRLNFSLRPNFERLDVLLISTHMRTAALKIFPDLWVPAHYAPSTEPSKMVCIQYLCAGCCILHPSHHKMMSCTLAHYRF